MSSMFGKRLRVSLFGQSHGECIGCVIDGLPAGEPIDLEALQAFMQRRAPGGAYATQRKESDTPHIVSGLYNGHTCGAPLTVLIQNSDTVSRDYDQLKDQPRPGHADYPAEVKYRGFQDHRGGGHFSARLTAVLAAAGGICLQILARKGIHVGAHLYSVGNVMDQPFDPLKVSTADFDQARTGFPTLSEEAAESMKGVIDAAREQLNSVGGIVECAVIGMPVGVGEPVFDGIENQIAKAVFAIPAVKGIEFGEGFACAKMKGSENNDPYMWQDGKPMLGSNHAGGILGGLTDGAPILFRAAFKPTPSIGLSQHTVSLSARRDAILEITGRHDPCVAVRAVPVVEAAAALAVLDMILMRED